MVYYQKECVKVQMSYQFYDNRLISPYAKNKKTKIRHCRNSSKKNNWENRRKRQEVKWIKYSIVR